MLAVPSAENTPLLTPSWLPSTLLQASTQSPLVRWASADSRCSSPSATVHLCSRSTSFYFRGQSSVFPATSPEQWCSPKGDFAPHGTHGNGWRCFWLSKLGWRGLPASSGRRPGVLLNVLRYTGQPPTENKPAQRLWC